MFAYCNNNPVNNIDINGMLTIGIFIGANICALFGISGSIGICFDNHGGIEVQRSYVDWNDETKYVGFVSASSGLSFQYTDRDTVEDLHGKTAYYGAGFGPFSGDFISFDDPINEGGEINGFQIMVGFDAGIDTHIMVQKTEPFVTLTNPSKKKTDLINIPNGSGRALVYELY